MKRKTLLWILLGMSIGLLIGVSIGMIMFYPSSEPLQPEPAVPVPSAEAPESETPEKQEPSEFSEAREQPEASAAPEIPETPEASEAAETPEASAEPETPEIPEAPEVTEAPEISAVPEAGDEADSSADAYTAFRQKRNTREVPEPVYWVERRLESAGDIFSTLSEINNAAYSGKIVTYPDHVAVVVGPFSDFDEAFSVSEVIRDASGFDDISVTIDIPRNHKDGQ